jgi:hypothetical protein
MHAFISKATTIGVAHDTAHNAREHLAISRSLNAVALVARLLMKKPRQATTTDVLRNSSPPMELH